MATVYKAYDTRLEREVAIKLIRKDAIPAELHEQILIRFEREARVLARLSHPNIVKVYDYGDYLGSPYLVMELLPGGTLKKRLGKPVHYREASRLLEPVASALAYAHQRGILHRDVKPSNILITDSGEPVLTDFGIAKLLESSDSYTLTGTGFGIGTPEYMAPEQGRGEEIDGRTDVYALGVVFYELVTGQKPYTANTPMAVLLKHFNDPLPRPKGYVADLPDGVEQVIFKVLAKNPVNRYENMTVFAGVLGDLAQGKAVEAIPAPPVKNNAVFPSVAVPSIPQPQWESVAAARPEKIQAETGKGKRRSLLFTGCAVVAVLLLVLVGIGAILSLQGNREPSLSQAQTQTAAVASEAARILQTATAETQQNAAGTAAAHSAGLTETLEVQQTDQAQETAQALAVITNQIVTAAAETPVIQNTPEPSLTAAEGRIVFVSDRDGNEEIYRMNADGSQQTRLTNSPERDSSPVWSPDGSRIAFVTERDGNQEIYVMNADGSQQSNLTNHPGQDEGPAWSPDGSRIAFWSQRENNYDIYVMNADGSQQTRLTNASGSDMAPSWSPDGSRIAFFTDRNGDYEIYAMNADGSQQANLTNSPANDVLPNWSPDGHRIVFASNRDGNFEIYTMNAEGSQQSRLTTSLRNEEKPGWSPDGRYIVFASSGGIYIMRVNGGQQTHLTNNAGNDKEANWGR